MEATLGRADMLVGLDEDSQVPLAQARELLRITGLKASVARQLTERAAMREVLRRAGIPIAGSRARSDGVCTLEVMTVGRVPAWFSATRRAGASIVLPREVEDPVDLDVRRMGYAALRALGARTGISSILWSRRADGSPQIHEIQAHPPHSLSLALMSHAHGADMHRAWANAVVNGHFAPIPRSYAAGVVFVEREGTGRRVTGIRGYDAVTRELGDVIVDARLPSVGSRAPGRRARDHYFIVRDSSTATVEAALSHIASSVVIEA